LAKDNRYVQIIRNSATNNIKGDSYIDALFFADSKGVLGTINFDGFVAVSKPPTKNLRAASRD
jgi:hypothetical protein